MVQEVKTHSITFKTIGDRITKENFLLTQFFMTGQHTTANHETFASTQDPFSHTHVMINMIRLRNQEPTHHEHYPEHDGSKIKTVSQNRYPVGRQHESWNSD